MSTQAQAPAPPGLLGRIRGNESWSLGDRIGVALAWAAGIMLCLIAAAIVLYMLVRGLQYLSISDLLGHPQPGLDQGESGGFLDPVLGTFMIAALGHRDRRARSGSRSRSGSPSTAGRAGWRGRSSRGWRSSPARRASCWRSSA